MNKFLNNIDNVIDDMLQGFLKLNKSVKLSNENDRVVYTEVNEERKVGLVSGGGSGHEPSFLGYLGYGLLDSVAVGEVFASPPAKAFLEAIKKANRENGVLCLIGNYQGDVMNIKMAQKLASKQGIQVDFITAKDDIASAPLHNYGQRHGLVGGLFLWKILGSKADQGASREALMNLGNDVVRRTKSICVGLGPCTIPAVGKPNFVIEEGKMEVGVGHHGETGISYTDIKTSKDIAESLTQKILDDFDFKEKKDLVVMVSGLGSTPLMEQYILYNDVLNFLKNKHNIQKSYVGDYVTSLDMNGVSITLFESNDELLKLLDSKSTPVGFKHI